MPRAFPTTNQSGNIRNLVIILSLAAGALGVIPVGNPSDSGLLGPAVAEAQNFGQRIIQGKVIGEGDSPVGGATVSTKPTD